MTSTIFEPISMHHRHLAMFHIAAQRRDLHLVQKSVVLRSLGISLLELFQPLFLLSNGLDLRLLMLFYAAQFLFTAFLAPFVGQISARLGFARASLLGLASFAVYLVCFASAPAVHFTSLIPATLLWAIYEAVYWPNYHHNFCDLTNASVRGSQTGLMNLLMNGSRFISPVAGGLIITLFGFPTLFGIALLSIVLSAVPFFSEQTVTSLADERPVSIVKDLLAPQHRLQQIVFFSLGAIFFLMEFAWPIFLYRFLPDFGELGLFTSIVTILSAMVGALLMLVIDRMVKSKLLVLGSIIYSAGWVLRSFIFDTFSFFMSDLVSRIGEGFVMLPMFAMSYDLRERQDHTSFQLQRILVVSLGYVGPALLIVAFGAPMLKVLLYTAPVFCFLLLGIIRIK